MKIISRSPAMASLWGNLLHGPSLPPKFQRLCNKDATFTRVGLQNSRLFATNTQSQQEKEEEKKKLNMGIAEFYNEWSGMWEDIYQSDHIHHGFYDLNSSDTVLDHQSAGNRMIEESLRFANISEESSKFPKSIVDVGCGLGGTSRYLVKKFGASCVGITLSPVQAERANTLAAAQGLADKVSFQVADALDQPFGDGKFDLLWSMESAEYMPDKEKFIAELARVAAPGATIVIVTWCHRDLNLDEKSLQQWEKDLLKKISDVYYLSAWCSSTEYVRLLESLSFQDIKTEDWSTYAAPCWPALIRSTLTWKGFTSILCSGLKTIKGMFAYPLMIEGFKKGVIKYTIITCRKPQKMEAE